MKPDQQRVKNLLADTVTLLCKNGLTYKEELRIEGLLGITIDNNEVFLVNINASFTGASTNNSTSSEICESPGLDLPNILKTSNTQLLGSTNHYHIPAKPSRIPCPKLSINSPTQLPKPGTISSPKLQLSSSTQLSAASKTTPPETLDTGQSSIKLENDDDDDVVIVSDMTNKRKHNKADGHNVESSHSTDTTHSFGNMDFSALQDDQAFTDSLVDTGPPVNSNEPPHKRIRSHGDTHYMPDVKHEQNNMTMNNSGSNQWENLTTMPGCSNWTGEDDTGLDDSQISQDDTVCILNLLVIWRHYNISEGIQSC